jgi:peptide deformylase
MVEQILQAGDSKLIAPNRDLDFKKEKPYILSVFDKMKAVMNENPFVGLAAPQIGENLIFL